MVRSVLLPLTLTTILAAPAWADPDWPNEPHGMAMSRGHSERGSFRGLGFPGAGRGPSHSGPSHYGQWDSSQWDSGPSHYGPSHYGPSHSGQFIAGRPRLLVMPRYPIDADPGMPRPAAPAYEPPTRFAYYCNDPPGYFPIVTACAVPWTETGAPFPQ